MHVGHRSFAAKEMCRAFEMEPESEFYAEELKRLVRWRKAQLVIITCLTISARAVPVSRL